MAPQYTQDISRTLESAIGAAGLSEADVARYGDLAWDALQRLRVEHSAGGPLLRHCYMTDDLAGIKEAAAGLADKASQIFLIGAGGSSLGAKTLIASGPSNQPNLTGEKSLASLVNVFENADPSTFLMTADMDLDDMAFVVVSKSGSTAETLALFAQCWSLMTDKLGAAAAAGHFLIVTGAHQSPLRRLATRYGLTFMDHEPDVSGRMSILSNVGLLPAAIDGVEGADARAGARAVADQALSADTLADCLPALGATVQVALMKEKGAFASVMMPYSDQLIDFSRWYCQLWAESLGKDGQGSIPYPTSGMVDQHSQLQFWLNGPAIGIYTLIDLEPADTPRIIIDDPDLAWMHGRTLGQMMHSAAQATADTLAANGRPVRRLHINRNYVGVETIGALAQHFLIETVLAGYMLGVDPYNQPAVDSGKALMRNYLTKYGAVDWA